MKRPSNTWIAWIGVIGVIATALITGYFSIIDKKPESAKTINSTVIAKDSSKVAITNNQNDIKGDFVSGNKIMVNKTIKKVKRTPKVEAPNALIVTQNQVGDNTVNVTQILDSMEFKHNGSIIKEIFYPSTGEYGDNILDKKTTQYSVGTYSMKAMIPKDQRLIVEVNGGKWKFNAFQAIPGWRHFDLKMNGEEQSAKFKTLKVGTLDLELYLTGESELEIAVYENDSKTVTWRKTIRVEK